jgi:SAM-dependent methyltransferase
MSETAPKNMTPLDYLDHQGWESIWQWKRVPPRFASFAAPNSTIVEWSATLPMGALVLDVGCGMGRHCVYLGQKGFRVAGCDLSPTGVANSIAACQTKNIPFDGRVCDMATLPWSDQTFGAAFSTSSIHHHLRAGVQQAVDEIWRVLKVGGLLFLDFPTTSGLDYAENRIEVAEGRYLEPEPNTFIDPAFTENSRDKDGFLPHHYFDEADLRELMKRYTLLRMEELMRPAKEKRGVGMVGKWIVWARKDAPVDPKIPLDTESG